MRPPRGFADLDGRSVGLFGLGVEGEATRRRVASLAAELILVDDVADPARGVLGTHDGGLEALGRCDVVLKSPGIAKRRADVVALSERVPVTSALALWMNDTDRSRVVAVTGTKGKSTTTALCTFVLTALGRSARSAGNIGVPPYDPDVADAEFTVLEVSSFQSADLTHAPAVVALTSLGSDHLDWHGDQATYLSDKLSITRLSDPHVTVLADDDSLASAMDQIGGDVRVASAAPTALAQSLGLLGDHNARNLGVALTAAAIIAGVELDAAIEAAAAHATAFVPLDGRLATVDEVAGVRFIDDGLATAALPAVAALAVFDTAPVALICGGLDRGIDYDVLVDALRIRSEFTRVVTLGPAGSRIGEACRARGVSVVDATDMDDAVRQARDAVRGGGVVLLSPAAPSFDRYRDWRERSADFRRAVAALGD